MKRLGIILISLAGLFGGMLGLSWSGVIDYSLGGAMWLFGSLIIIFIGLLAWRLSPKKDYKLTA